jgi:hypothetical protein
MADVGVGRSLRLMARPGRFGGRKGLVDSQLAIAAPLSASAMPSPALGRAALIAFWDDAAAAEAFLTDDAVVDVFASGLTALLEPLRVFGTWPGLDRSLPKARTTQYRGPALVLTLGRLRIRRTRPFLRTSARAAGAALGAPGFVWGTALARPPFVATCSLWTSTDSLGSYAYGDTGTPHADAITTDRERVFHKRSAFARCRPIEVRGTLDGRNPLRAEQLTMFQQPVDSARAART